MWCGVGVVLNHPRHRAGRGQVWARRPVVPRADIWEGQACVRSVSKTPTHFSYWAGRPERIAPGTIVRTLFVNAHAAEAGVFSRMGRGPQRLQARASEQPGQLPSARPCTTSSPESLPDALKHD